VGKDSEPEPGRPSTLATASPPEKPPAPAVPEAAAPPNGTPSEAEVFDPTPPPISQERRAETRPTPAPPVAASASASAPASVPVNAVRRDLVDRREPLFRDCQGYRLRLDPADLARLRELAGSRGRSDDEIGEAFFDGQATRLAESLAGDVPVPSEIRVIVDPYSRQAFLALENRIRGILSF